MKIKFQNNLYRKEAISEAIKAYSGSGIADFNLEKKSSYFEVEIDMKVEFPEDYFKNEFCNYVLSEMKSLI